MLLSDVILSFPQESPHNLQQVENTKNQRSMWKKLLPGSAFLPRYHRTKKTWGPSFPRPKEASCGMMLRYSCNARVMHSLDSEVTIRHPRGNPPAALWVSSMNTLQSYRSMPPEASMCRIAYNLCFASQTSKYVSKLFKQFLKQFFSNS